MNSEKASHADSPLPSPNTVSDSSHYSVPEVLIPLENKLLQLGLETNQCRMYVFLLEKGPKRIAEITNLIGFERTHAYHIICGLQNKGLVMATFNHPIQFHAVPAEKAIDIMSKFKRRKDNRVAQ